MIALSYHKYMGEMIMNKTILTILASIAITSVLITVIIIYSTQVNNESGKEVINEDTDILYLVETPGYTIDGALSKYAKYIVIGKVSKTTSDMYKDTVHSSIKVFNDITLDVEQELTNTYNDKQITFRTLGGSIAGIEADTIPSKVNVGDRLLVFLADKEPDSIWGDNYYVMGLIDGIFKIVDGKVYGKGYPNGIPLEEVIQIITKTRTQ